MLESRSLTPPHSEQDAPRMGRTTLKVLRQAQIQMIDEALIEVGDFGEVRLIVTKGRLRFVVTQRSHDALRWEHSAQRSQRLQDALNDSDGS